MQRGIHFTVQRESSQLWSTFLNDYCREAIKFTYFEVHIQYSYYKLSNQIWCKTCLYKLFTMVREFDTHQVDHTYILVSYVSYAYYIAIYYKLSSFNLFYQLYFSKIHIISGIYIMISNSLLYVFTDRNPFAIQENAIV